MAALINYVKRDTTVRTSTATVPAEVTQYTVPWSDLTGAGFAAGDTVLMLVMTKLAADGVNSNSKFQIGLGTTYAGRVDIGESYDSHESAAVYTSAFTNLPYSFVDQRTLVTNENIYFSLLVSTGTAASDDFSITLLKVGGTNGLGTNDLVYAEATHSGDAPTAYNTSGASVTTPASGDWLFFAVSRWLHDSTSLDLLMAIAVDGVDTSEIRSEGEDIEDITCHGTLAYAAGLASSKVARVRYRVDSAGHDCVRTAIVGIRLDAFQDHVGVQSANTITHSVVDTFQEAWGPTYTASQAGNVLAIFYGIHDWNTASTPENTKWPYGRIQLAGADWPESGANRVGLRDNGANAIGGPILFGYASVSSGSLDFDFDVAEDNDVTPTYACDVQVGVLFSLELGGATTHEGAAALSASGSVAVSGVRDLVSGVALSGSGAVAAAGSQLFVSAAALAGSGTVVAAGSQELVSAAALPGSGTLVAGGVRDLAAAISLSGSGSLVTAAVMDLAAVLDLSGSGSVAAQAVMDLVFGTELAGTGSVVAVGSLGGTTQEGAAALAGTGSVVAAAVRDLISGVLLAGSGSVAVAGVRDLAAAAAIAGSGSLSAAAVRDLVSGSALNGAGSLTAAGSRELVSAAMLSGSGVVSVSGVLDLSGAVTLSGSGLVIPQAAVTYVSGVSLSGAGSLSAVGSLEGAFVEAVALLAGQGSASLSAVLILVAAATLAGQGTFAIEGDVILSVTAEYIRPRNLYDKWDAIGDESGRYDRLSRRGRRQR